MENEFRLNKKPKGSSITLRKHLEQVYKTTGVKPKQLIDEVQPQKEFAYLLNWYFEARGPSQLTYLELKSWSDITGKRIKAWEAEVIMMLDRVNWKVTNE